jgi:hypothetical protein
LTTATIRRVRASIRVTESLAVFETQTVPGDAAIQLEARPFVGTDLKR